ncbi:MAG TPA: hypothetical protein DG753_03755 [Clostridium sp.]|nr:hypothetical protein [Clostridium sp.]
MSYVKEYLWELVPTNVPAIRRKCPKCGEKTDYISTGKFRVNANKSSIDIWLIYQCEKCKASWNMDIYSRVKAGSLNEEEYKRFLANEEELAKEYGFDIEIHNKNKVELRIKDISYYIKKVEILEENSEKDEVIIKIKCKYPCELRIDKILADNLNISRNRVKRMCEKGNIIGENNENLLKSKVEDGMIIHII